MVLLPPLAGSMLARAAAPWDAGGGCAWAWHVVSIECSGLPRARPSWPRAVKQSRC